MLGIIGLYSNYELILSILESQAQTSGIGPDSQEFTAQVYFSCGLGPAAPAPAVLRSAAIGKKSLNSGGSSSSVYNLSEK
jgi:hypothetical protein